MARTVLAKLWDPRGKDAGYHRPDPEDSSAPSFQGQVRPDTTTGLRPSLLIMSCGSRNDSCREESRQLRVGFEPTT
jgi:hypothetical protein